MESDIINQFIFNEIKKLGITNVLDPKRIIPDSLVVKELVKRKKTVVDTVITEKKELNMDSLGLANFDTTVIVDTLEYDEIVENIETIRSVDKKLQLNTAILADLQGPKLRIGKIKDGTIVKSGDRILFKTDSSFEGDDNKAYMNYKNFPKDVSKDERILLDDGKLIFKIISTNKINEVEAEVIQGGVLKSNKGVNLPNTKIH